MQLQGDVFDPTSVVAILKNLDWPQIPKGKANFEKLWQENVCNELNLCIQNQPLMNTPPTVGFLGQ